MTNLDSLLKSRDIALPNKVHLVKVMVHFQGKPLTITVIQVFVLTINAEEAEVEQFYEDLQDLLELTPKKDVLFIIGDWNAKVEVKKYLE